MTRLVVLGGTGDAYLILALVAAFHAHHNQDPEVILHSKLAAVGGLFPDVRCRADDALVLHAEQDQAFQRSHDNKLFGDVFFAHPCFERSGVRIDQLTAKESVSQADMYRAILRLPLDAPLALPVLPSVDRVSNLVLMLTESVSWPNTQPSFWPALAAKLEVGGHRVIQNDKRWPLSQLFEIAARAEWVIGPQCGVMSILATGRFPCRKTFASPSTDNYVSPSENWWAIRTYPYGYVTKFAGEDYDVDEYKITDDNHIEVVAAIAGGVSARFSSPGAFDPSPVMTVTMPLTPGDFLDRLAVLTVKRARFSPERRAAIEREYLRYAERRETLALPIAVDRIYNDLLLLHERTFDVLEHALPNSLTIATYTAAVEANRVRVELKQMIDEACHAPYSEVKSYYGISEIKKAAE